MLLNFCTAVFDLYFDGLAYLGFLYESDNWIINSSERLTNSLDVEEFGAMYFLFILPSGSYSFIIIIIKDIFSTEFNPSTTFFMTGFNNFSINNF